MKIVIVNGRGGNGKTTFETMVQKIGDAHGYKIKILSTINMVKAIAKNIGWTGTKTMADRKFLSDLKDALTNWNDSPYKTIQKDIKELEEEGVDLVFVDCREPYEIARFVKDYNALTLLVKRANETKSLGNHADDDVYNYDYDIIIDNSRGLNELMQEATIFVETFLND